MEQREVRLKVEIETESAAAAALEAGRPQPPNPAAQALPGAPAQDAGAGQGAASEREALSPAAPSSTQRSAPTEADDGIPGQRRDVDEEEVERRVTDRVRREVLQAGRNVTGGGGRLSDQVAGLAASIPGIGVGVRAAEFAERYGAAALAAAAEAAPPGTRMALEAARETAEDFTRRIAGARASLDAVGAAFEVTREVASGLQVLEGRVDPAGLAKFGSNRYAIEKAMLQAEAARRQFGTQAAGAALGSLIGQSFTDMMGPAAGR